jgi:hypothetical protein
VTPAEASAPPIEASEASAGAVVVPPAEADPDDVKPAPVGQTEFDPADFLFGPSPEPDPAAFLLEPASPAQDTESVAAANDESAMMATPVLAAPQPANDTQPEPTSPPVKADPLAPLNAMSAAERLAIFS